MSDTVFAYSESLVPINDRGPSAGRPLGTVVRAIQAIELLAERTNLRSAEVASQLGISRSGAYNLMRTLEALHFVHQDPGSKEFSLGWKIFELGQCVLAANETLRIAAEGLDRLAAVSGESALLAVHDGNQVLYVGLSESAHSVRLTAALGRRTSLHGSASGKALLLGFSDAALDELISRGLEAHTPLTIIDPGRFREELRLSRLRGFAVCLGEFEVSEASVSVPLYDPSGVIHGALTVGGPTARFTEENVRRFAQVLSESAIAMTQESGRITAALLQQVRRGSRG